jgi:hypothetical protein
MTITANGNVNANGNGNVHVNTYRYVNQSSVHDWFVEHVCERILLWQARVLEVQPTTTNEQGSDSIFTDTNTNTNSVVVHNLYSHNPFEMCQVQEM